MRKVSRAAPYGLAAPSEHRIGSMSRLVTVLIVVGPIVALAIAVPLLWERAIALRDVVLAASFYVVTAFGVTVGYHRLFTHRSFRASRPLRIALAVAGSFAVQGSVTSWVALHRRHHRFADQPGDPHSPRTTRASVGVRLRGLLHAHVGWLFKSNPTFEERYAADLLRDPDTRIVTTLFPLFAIASLALPFLLGWGLSRDIGGALTALLWAGIARMVLLHHVTWSVNSICHAFGTRPATQDDLSTNFAPLALLSLGEAWHNFHHAHPSCARHGAYGRQIDPSAALIRVFERAGWATKVRWPTALQITTSADAEPASRAVP
jgi:stearoyl-CoA desaturase (Delta-9 desaturase)